MCIDGYGPTQIANILFSDGIPTPTEYWQAQGRKASNLPNLPVVPHKWAARTVADILERLEYCGHTVNFRSTTRSFKDKTEIHRIHKKVVHAVRYYTEIRELTPAIVNEFINHIIVSKKQVIDGKTA